MDYTFELSPFELEFKKWYEDHGIIMPWNMFFIVKGKYENGFDKKTISYYPIDPCCQNYSSDFFNLFDKSTGLLDFSLTSSLYSDECNIKILKEPRYFPAIFSKSESDCIFYVYSGKTTIDVSDGNNKVSYNLVKGDVLFLPSEYERSTKCCNDDSILLSFMIHSRNNLQNIINITNSNITFNRSLNHLPVFHTDSDEWIRSLVNQMLKEAIEHKANYQHMIYKIMEVFISHVIREYKCNDVFPAKNGNTLSAAFIEYLMNHYEHFSLEQMARHFGMSTSHISRIFKRSTGITIINQLTDIRINVAEYLLLNTIASVDAISLQVGYSDTSYFIEVFKKYKGTTPLKYRALKN